MAWSLVAHTAAGSTSGGSGTVTTSAINTTGATVILLMVSSYGQFTEPSAGNISDNQGNSYSKVTSAYTSSNCIIDCWVSSVPATVGASHTVTVTLAGSYPAVGVSAWSGGTATGDGVNGTSSTSASSLATGTVTATVNGDLFLTGTSMLATSVTSIGGGFTVLDTVANTSGQNIGLSHGYLIETAAGTENATWNLPSANELAVGLWAIKGAAGAAPPSYWRRQEIEWASY